VFIAQKVGQNIRGVKYVYSFVLVILRMHWWHVVIF